MKDLKAEALEQILEAERQVMLWEKKTQLERETQVPACKTLGVPSETPLVCIRLMYSDQEGEIVLYLLGLCANVNRKRMSVTHCTRITNMPWCSGNLLVPGTASVLEADGRGKRNLHCGRSYDRTPLDPI